MKNNVGEKKETTQQKDIKKSFLLSAVQACGRGLVCAGCSLARGAILLSGSLLPVVSVEQLGMKDLATVASFAAFTTLSLAPIWAHLLFSENLSKNSTSVLKENFIKFGVALTISSVLTAGFGVGYNALCDHTTKKRVKTFVVQEMQAGRLNQDVMVLTPSEINLGRVSLPNFISPILCTKDGKEIKVSFSRPSFVFDNTRASSEFSFRTPP